MNIRLRALCLLTIAVFAIVSRIMIGYSAFVNPVALHSHASFESALFESSPCLAEHQLDIFKLKRKIAFETLIHFPAYLLVSSFEFKSVMIENLHLVEVRFFSLDVPGFFRPPRSVSAL